MFLKCVPLYACLLLGLLFSPAFARYDDYEDEIPVGKNACILDDYGLYELIDRMLAVTGCQTFYQLLEIDESATNKEISTAFRKKSLLWHPDRHIGDSSFTEKAAILSQVASVLRHDATRERYHWLLYEAPAWYKSSYYVKKYYQQAFKFSLSQVFMLILFFITSIQILAQIALRLEHYIRCFLAKQHLDSLGKNEIKRLERKVQKVSDITEEMRAQSPLLEHWVTLQQDPPLFSLSSLWIIRFCLFVARLIFEFPFYLRDTFMHRK